MTDLITKIDALYEKAPPGPWKDDSRSLNGQLPLIIGANGSVIADLESCADAGVNISLIIALHNSWPAIRDVLVAALWQVKNAPGVTVTELHEALARLNGGKL